MQKENETELNEMREIAGLTTKKIYVDDEYTRNIKNLAGL